jgi:hypothetical protein
LAGNARQLLGPKKQQRQDKKYDRIRKTHHVIITEWLQKRQRRLESQIPATVLIQPYLALKNGDSY